MKTRAAVVLGVAMGGASLAHAEIVSFNVDPARSTLVLSGAVRYYFNGSVFGFGEQAPGSLAAAYAGTITGDLDGSTITFGGGSSIVGLANPAGPFLPAGPGSTDVYGMRTFSAGTFADNRMYDLVLDLTGGAATSGAAFGGSIAYVGGSGGIFPYFDASPRSLAGVSAANTGGGLVSLTLDGDVQTLTIPIDTNLILFGNGTGVETRLTGSLVATRVVPAPGAGLAMIGALGLFTRRRR